MAAVSKPRVTKERPFKTKAMPSFFINDVPSNKLVIQIGRTLFVIKVANPNVNTTIRDDFLFSFNSSR